MRTNRSLVMLAVATIVSSVFVTQPGALADALTSTAVPLSGAEAAQLSQDANIPVVIVLRGNTSGVLSELNDVHARKIHSFQLVNALAATVSQAEADRLAADPDVLAVVPDALIKGAPPPAQQVATAFRPQLASPQDSQVPGICPAPGKTLLEPEALSLSRTASDDSTAKTAQSLGYDGEGVKVGFIAQGIDIDNPDFIRPDGSHVFVDYKDFSGDGPDAPSLAIESYIDATAIAAQGNQTYDIQNFSGDPLPSSCKIRLLGMAPGAQLVGLKAFAQNGFTTISALLQSIDYAANTAHVDVLNESFAGNPIPDSRTANAIKLFNDAAVAKGVTITVSSGDAGSANTQGSPATDPNVINVGASTALRFDVQTAFGGGRPFARTGWLSDNISPLSSSGFNQDGQLIDLVAPGDSSFAVCTPDLQKFIDCQNFLRQASAVTLSGGTSESAPRVAGAAALVIQAYRDANKGKSPTPALVKQILLGTADDLGAPADEQGAGRVDSFRAVQAALGNDASILLSKSQLDCVAAPGTKQTWQVNVKNDSESTKTIRFSGRAFRTPQVVKTGAVTLDDTTSQHFTDFLGVPENFGSITFTVPANTKQLNASIAFPGDPAGGVTARVRVALVDPNGKFATQSDPQGMGNFGHVDVANPAAGTWTAFVFSAESAFGGTVGTVQFQASTATTTSFGTVSPSSLTLGPFDTGTVTVTATTPANPGDASGAILLDNGSGVNTLPVSLRSLVDPTKTGTFSGTLTGGNGRQPNTGQAQYYQFDVPSGQHDLDANVALSNGVGQNLFAFLIDPNGNEAARGSSQLATAFNPQTRASTLTPQGQDDLYVRAPQAGRWTLAVNFAGATAGEQVSQPFTGSVGLNKVDVKVTGLPSGTLPAGKPVTATVSVHNTGTAPQNVFPDVRLSGSASLPLVSVEPASVALPLPAGGASPAWLVPSGTTKVSVQATASRPVTFDYGPEVGDPDVTASTTGTTASGAISGTPLPAGLWGADPAELGPFPSSGATPGTATLLMTATTEPFDKTATSTVGDLWLTAVTPSSTLPLLTVQAGQTVVLPVTFTPTGASGSTVRGTLYVDTLVVGSTPSIATGNFEDPADTEATADTLAGLSYSYKIS